MQRHAGFVAVLGAVAAAAQTPERVRTPANSPIQSITIAGNKSLTTDAILTASGLFIDGNGGSATFEAARDRLLDTGYFDLVSYSFKQQNQGFAVAFTVKDVKEVYPVRAEALPITPDKLTRILQSNDPLFNGVLPGTKRVIDRAALLIEQSLAADHPDLHIRAKVVATGPERYEIQFSPAEGLPIIADVTFEGSQAATSGELRLAMIEGAIGQPFSDASIHALLDRLIRPAYEKQGYMAVSFPKITSKPDAAVKGVDVHVTVVDGPQFRLGEVSVRGPLPNDARRILGIAKVPRMDLINFDEFTQAVPRILDALHNEGYLDATVAVDRSIDNAKLIVDVWFDANPGALYTFGRLEVIGLGLDGEAAIRKMWGVKPGDPFPAGYQDRFVRGVKDEQMFDNLGDITVMPNINRQTHVVNVTIFFAAAPAPTKRGTRF
jgi:outer membrane protein insertion porin family